MVGVDSDEENITTRKVILRSPSTTPLRNRSILSMSSSTTKRKLEVMTSSSVKSDLYIIYQFGDCASSEGQSQPKFQVVRQRSCGWREGKVVGKEEKTRRRVEIRDVVVTTGEREFTELSVEVWVSAWVLVVSGIEWMSVARESNTRVEQVVKIIAELKC
jgi:hypothetical protein